MANWYYYNESGEKIEVTGGQLKGLAKAGVITPDTMVETEEGKTAPARKVKGLTFGEPTQPESTTPDTVSTDEPSPFNISASIPVEQPPIAQPAPSSFCTYCGQPVQPTAVACTACGADPRVHRKFCYACGTPMNEVQVICTKCHTPVAGTGSVPVGQTPSQVAAPVQSVVQPQPGATAQLVIERSKNFMFQTDVFEIWINGFVKGKVANGENIEISAPVGSVNLEIRSPLVLPINPVTLNLAAGQKKKITLALRPFYVPLSLFVVAISFILGIALSAILFGAHLPEGGSFMLGVIPGFIGVIMYVKRFPAYIAYERDESN